MNNEQALEQFIAPAEDTIDDAFVKSIVFDVDYGFESNLPKHIVANFDEVEKALAASLEKYRQVVVTEDTLQAAKATCALLSKQSAAIEEERKAVKKGWNKPYVEFENRIKRLTSQILDAREIINAQVKAFEDKEKNEKREKVVAIYNEYAGELTRKWIGFDKLFKEKYLNKTFRLDAVREELKTACDRCEADLKFLVENYGQYIYSAISSYAFHFSLADAIAAAQLQKTREEEAETYAQEKTAPAVRQEEDNGEKLTIDFRVYATERQLKALKTYLTQNGIRYGRVPKGEEE